MLQYGVALATVEALTLSMTVDAEPMNLLQRFGQMQPRASGARTRGDLYVLRERVGLYILMLSETVCDRI